MLSFADAQVGRLLDALDQSPIAKNTIVVLWSDHGFHLGEKDHIEKFALWEKANHVPFIIAAPGVTKPGSRCEQPVDLTVLYPTLMELCRLDAKTKCDGPSAVPLLRDPDALWPYPAISTYGKEITPSEPSAGATSAMPTARRNCTITTTIRTNGRIWPNSQRWFPLSKLRARIALGQAAEPVSNLRR